ncbi:hypothetical protein B0H16DRAFT_1695011 [Mycena metata]|uniref:Uncharacterized protein n=1 Tax=Mycena metata TaxID=1033252 RepID=A0AAD7MYK4_9AGAR|nr:hypothetical protein B0H16DRAFT_1695011 [Mycena metata]
MSPFLDRAVAGRISRVAPREFGRRPLVGYSDGLALARSQKAMAFWRGLGFGRPRLGLVLAWLQSQSHDFCLAWPWPGPGIFKAKPGPKPWLSGQTKARTSLVGYAKERPEYAQGGRNRKGRGAWYRYRDGEGSEGPYAKLKSSESLAILSFSSFAGNLLTLLVSDPGPWRLAPKVTVGSTTGGCKPLQVPKNRPQIRCFSKSSKTRTVNVNVATRIKENARIGCNFYSPLPRLLPSAPLTGILRPPKRNLLGTKVEATCSGLQPREHTHLENNEKRATLFGIIENRVLLVDLRNIEPSEETSRTVMAISFVQFRFIPKY